MKKGKIGNTNDGKELAKQCALHVVSESDLFECPACDQKAAYVAQGFTSRADETRSYDMDVEHCVCKSCGHDWWD
jgi:DNA-directed RNA polymerase subunit M/transcription elongation factor TFIIS